MRGFTIAESIYYVAGLFLTLINITYVALLLYIYSLRPINKLLFAKCCRVYGEIVQVALGAGTESAMSYLHAKGDACVFDS